ncbi:hypothetical protein [Anaerohalosphaera lusitana]|uniref:hypothetical protein n=1 Tax=Anaerohalosphaera lusitana TaxID=1936003 RepID=UPI0011BAD7E0|nr:hypothetical protein [Anaerohalosphaera lusitana]
MQKYRIFRVMPGCCTAGVEQKFEIYAQKPFQKCFENGPKVSKTGQSWVKDGQKCIRAPLTIHFGGQANLFGSERRQTKTALATTKAVFVFLAGTRKSSTCRSKAIIRATHKKGTSLLCLNLPLFDVIGLFFDPAAGIYFKFFAIFKIDGQFI